LILTIKYRLKPNKTQIKIFDRWLAITLDLYNIAIKERNYILSSFNHRISRYDQYNELPDLKIEFPIFKEVHSDVLQETLDRVETSFETSYKRFKKGREKDINFWKSFTYKRFIKIQNNKIFLPKIGWINFFNSKEISNIKTATIYKLSNKKWDIIITYEVSVLHKVNNNNPIGIDVGIINHSYLSDGNFYKFNYNLSNNLEIIKELQRKLSKDPLDIKIKEKIRKIYKKISLQRKDFNHKLSSFIVKKYTGVYMEDLHMKKMRINPELTRKLRENGFYNYRQLISYKCLLYGKTFIAVNPAYTSQTCPSCNHIDKLSRKSQSIFICTNCNYENNADLVGALNILRRGTALFNNMN